MIQVLIIVFLSAITITSYVVVRKKPPEKFTPVYLLSITVKIFLSCVFVIVLILVDKPSANYNIVFFLIGYGIFTTVEVAFLLLKKKA
jgi:hypothetical protein